MKTWQMIKELTENPDKKFRRVGEDRELYVGVHNNFVAWEGDYALETGGETFEIYTDLEWDEVKKPVDFMTAIKALNGGKVIYAIRADGYREVFNPAGKQTDWGVAVKQSQGYAVDTETILYSKWYIEDQEELGNDNKERRAN